MAQSESSKRNEEIVKNTKLFTFQGSVRFDKSIEITPDELESLLRGLVESICTGYGKVELTTLNLGVTEVK